MIHTASAHAATAKHKTFQRTYVGWRARPLYRFIASFCLSICVATHIASTVSAEPSADVLPIWREVFARPDTSLNAIPAPADNSVTTAKIQLGKKLFQDTRLSGNDDRSCATCHHSNRAFTDGRKRAAALDGMTKLANTPPLINLAWAKRLFWDGRTDSLEDQVSFPIRHPQELAGNWVEITQRLSADPELIEDFKIAFPDNPSPDPGNIAAALASYERTLVTPSSRFDRFINGETNALTETELYGFVLFVGKAGCISCHSGWRFTDDRMHRTGRTLEPIKTPTLRKLARTAPYMHDGSAANIGDVITHYERLPTNDASLSPNIIRPLRLAAEEKIALIAFLNSID